MPIALYQKIYEDLLQKITSGSMPVGSLLPTEMELVESYRASRNTVRMALHQLQARGLISRRRNRGTMVEAVPGAVATFTQSLSSLEGLVMLASTARRTIIDHAAIVLDPANAKALQCPVGSKWVRLTMVRQIPGKSSPLGWTDAYVDPQYDYIFDLASRHPERLLTDLIETASGRRIESVEQSVSTCALPETLSQALGVAKGTPALRIVRHYRDVARGLVVVTKSMYPENRYSLMTTLVRNL